MPRVLLTGFCAVPGPRRVGVQMRHVIRSLASSHTVDLLVVREGEQGYVERQGAVRILRVPTPEADLKSQVQAFQRALKRQLDGADYDVVHCRDSWSGIPVLEARSRLDYAVVYDLTRAPLGERGTDAELDAQYERDEEACLLAADLVLAPTATAVKALQGRGRPERVVLSPPGVDVDRFDWEDAPAPGPPRILYAGSIDPGRGVRVLIRAMVAILREVDARLILAGPIAPKFDASLRDGIREMGLANKVELLGSIDHDQLPTLIATATVCVVPAAFDLTPNPTVLYPTKLLEYMACRKAIVAPRRETVTLVCENNREALLFDPGDPIDLARKVLRLLGEPQLRERIAGAAYDRVRRDFTASAARRALHHAYSVVTERFAAQFAGQAVAEPPKIDLLPDDEFEATVFEEGPQAPAVDTALNRIHTEALDDALASLGEPGDAGNTSSGSLAAPPPPRESDETMERPPVGRRARDSGSWTASSPATARAGSEDWVVADVGRARRTLDTDSEHTDDASTGDDGTPAEGIRPATPPPVMETSFVAGEIDVPTPPPERREDPEEKTPAVEFTAASALLGNADPPDPDTGSRTTRLVDRR